MSTMIHRSPRAPRTPAKRYSTSQREPATRHQTQVIEKTPSKQMKDALSGSSGKVSIQFRGGNT